MSDRTMLATIAAGTSTLLTTAAGGAWENEFPVTQDPVPQHASYVATMPDDTVHVLWPDWTDFEDTHVTLTSSPDRGATWSKPAVLFDGAAYDNFDLQGSDTGLHLILVEFTEGEENEFKHPYHTRSVDDGVTFSPPVRIGERDNMEAIRLFSAPGRLFLYGQDYVEDFMIDYLYVSTDGGTTWTEKPLLPGLPLQNPHFAVRDGTIHLVTGGLLGSPEIRYAWSDDDGDTWSTPVVVSSGAGPHSQLPWIAIDADGVLHVVWEDDRSDAFNVRYARSDDGGATWAGRRRMNDTFYGARAKLLADETGLHLVWCQYHGPGWPSSWSSFDYGIIWHRTSADAGATWSDEFRVSQNESIPPMELPDKGANVVKLAPYTTGFCALWQDKRDGNVDLYMRNELGAACPEDLDGSGAVDFGDVLAILAAWGAPGGPEDLDGSGAVDFGDLLVVLATWGPCP